MPSALAWRIMDLPRILRFIRRPFNSWLEFSENIVRILFSNRCAFAVGRLLSLSGTMSNTFFKRLYFISIFDDFSHGQRLSLSPGNSLSGRLSTKKQIFIWEMSHLRLLTIFMLIFCSLSKFCIPKNRCRDGVFEFENSESEYVEWRLIYYFQCAPDVVRCGAPKLSRWDLCSTNSAECLLIDALRSGSPWSFCPKRNFTANRLFDSGTFSIFSLRAVSFQRIVY